MNKERKFPQPEINQVEELSAKLIDLYHDLAEKNRQLEESELSRKNMFSNITHDLRALVSAISGAAERLCKEEIGAEEHKKLANIIDSRASVLEKLINDLYLSNLIDQPEFSLSLIPLDVAPILEEYLISMEGAGKLSGREYILSIPDGCSAAALIDPQYFIRVLDNLLSNALRFTETGDAIELGCRESSGPEGKVVELFLSDSGAGVHPDDLPRIFDRAFTAEAARTPGKSGSGLGLTIAKTIVEKHGGEIRCDSIYGEGTVFTISLPRI